ARGSSGRLMTGGRSRSSVHVVRVWLLRFRPDPLKFDRAVAAVLTVAAQLEIVDDGAGQASRAIGGGHGLVGMRERVALYGGRFDAHRQASGGFAVRVLLPIR